MLTVLCYIYRRNRGLDLPEHRRVPARRRGDRRNPLDAGPQHPPPGLWPSVSRGCWGGHWAVEQDLRCSGPSRNLRQGRWAVGV